MDPKHSRVTLAWGNSTHKVTWYFDRVVTWRMKNILSSLSQGARPLSLAGWWLEWEDPTQHVMWHLDHAVTWQQYSGECTFVPLLVEALSEKQIDFKWLWQHWKCVACIKEVFKVTYYFLAGFFYGKKYPDKRAGSVSGIIYFCVYIKYVSSRRTRHIINTGLPMPRFTNGHTVPSDILNEKRLSIIHQPSLQNHDDVIK